MRLWSLHPQYLDAQGLVALWREALLAQAVLRGKTRGYQHHPQLQRFRAHPQPISAMNSYLSRIHAEATARGYSFDAGKVGPLRRVASIPVAAGQLEYEWTHLLRKLRKRNPEAYRRWRETQSPGVHPLFRRVAGPVADWERVQ
jgi:hypothetical protein